MGQGPPLVFLHGEDGLLFCRAVPRPPGRALRGHRPDRTRRWAGSTRPAHVRTLDDIAYLYLDLLETIGAPVALVGASIGGWLAAEMATKSQRGPRAAWSWCRRSG